MRVFFGAVYTARLRMLMPTRFSEKSLPPRVGLYSSALWVVLLSLSGGGLSCSGDRVDEDSAFGSNGVVRIGYANEAPFAYYENETGRLTGESVEVTHHVLKKMGVSEFEGVLTEFASLIPGLKAGRFDVIAAGMWIIPPRCREINFSEPILCIGQGFVVKAGNPLRLHGYEDVAQHPTARLGVVAGGVEIRFARAVGVPEDRMLIFPDAPSAISGLQANRMDALAGPEPAHKDILRKANDPNLERAQPFNPPNVPSEPARLCSGIGFRKEDVRFLEEFNHHLKALIGTEEHLQIIETFGLTESELPTDVTQKELCRPISGT